MAKTSEAGRYHLRWKWEGEECGHIITMETLENGTRRFYDPQIGFESRNILPWFRNNKQVLFDLKEGISVYRVDTLQLNPLIVKGIVKKAGSSGVTPMMTTEQEAWWAKNVEKKATGGVKGDKILSPKDKAAADLINWFTQNAPSTKVGKDKAKRFEVTSKDNKNIIINKKFYNELISKYKSDELYTEKLQYAQKAHEYIQKATLRPSEAGRHHKENFRVYVYEDKKYNIEFKVKEGQDGDFLYVMRLYKK